LFYDPSAAQDEDVIGVANGCEPVCDDDARAEQSVEVCDDLLF
jgi:hypothetical protein